MMVLSVIATGRQWGDKREEQSGSVTVGGVKCTLTDFDVWEGGDGSGDIRPQYYRMKILTLAGQFRDDRVRCASHADLPA